MQVESNLLSLVTNMFSGVLVASPISAGILIYQYFVHCKQARPKISAHMISLLASKPNSFSKNIAKSLYFPKCCRPNLKVAILCPSIQCVCTGFTVCACVIWRWMGLYCRMNTSLSRSLSYSQATHFETFIAIMIKIALRFTLSLHCLKTICSNLYIFLC